MSHFSPLNIALRVVFYALMVFGMAEAIRFDAVHPMEEGYFGEISLTEIFQEIILLILVVFYLLLGTRHKPVQPVANLIAMFLLISFIREFNFIMNWWAWPALLVLLLSGWLVWRDFKKLKGATREFFAQPASAWFFAGFLITFIFSRLMGRSKFWLALYDENSYRLAKAATEEGLELLGNTFMLVSAIECTLVFWNRKKAKNQ